MKKIDKNTYINWFRKMSFWRKFEDKCRSLYLRRKIRGFLHLYNGQEAIPAGITHVIDKNKDKIITGYRCHILAISMGVDPKRVMSELCGKVTGTSMGIGGSMHIFSKKNNFYGGFGIVGAQIPIGVGIAFSDKYFNRNSVTFTIMGDGAVSQGSFHESLNLASLWKLPVVFICENNKYAMGTSINRYLSNNRIYKIGKSYNIPSYKVNGMDPVDISKYCLDAVERARNNLGPTFLEIITYRFRGHSMSDSESYRNKLEINKYKEKDPILLIKNIILKNNWINNTEIEEINKSITKEINECVKFSEDSDFPDKNNMYNFVYKEKNYPFWDKIINLK